MHHPDADYFDTFFPYLFFNRNILRVWHILLSPFFINGSFDRQQPLYNFCNIAIQIKQIRYICGFSLFVLYLQLRRKRTKVLNNASHLRSEQNLCVLFMIDRRTKLLHFQSKIERGKTNLLLHPNDTSQDMSYIFAHTLKIDNECVHACMRVVSKISNKCVNVAIKLIARIERAAECHLQASIYLVIVNVYSISTF